MNRLAFCVMCLTKTQESQTEAMSQKDCQFRQNRAGQRRQDQTGQFKSSVVRKTKRSEAKTGSADTFSEPHQKLASSASQEKLRKGDGRYSETRAVFCPFRHGKFFSPQVATTISSCLLDSFIRLLTLDSGPETLDPELLGQVPLPKLRSVHSIDQTA